MFFVVSICVTYASSLWLSFQMSSWFINKDKVEQNFVNRDTAIFFSFAFLQRVLKIYTAVSIPDQNLGMLLHLLLEKSRKPSILYSRHGF